MPLILLLSLMIGLSASLVWQQPKISLHDQATLKEAKQALINHALGYPLRSSSSGRRLVGFPPYLPCPYLGQRIGSRTQSDGFESGSCGNKYQASFGRLPWRSLGISPPANHHAECFWYLVSSNAKRSAVNQRSNHWNRDADEWLVYQGQRAVAAVISVAPKGTAKGIHADETCRQFISAESYFDRLPDTQTEQIELDIHSAFNPQQVSVELISKKEIFAAHTRRQYYQQLTRQLMKLLGACVLEKTVISSTTLSIPHPAPLRLSDDRRQSQYKSDTNTFSGRMPFSGEDFNYQTCNAFQINTSAYSRDYEHPLYRHWLHTKNLWFYSIRPNCLNDGRCIWIDGKAYVAIISFAGNKTTNQDRTSERLGGNRQAFKNYLQAPLMKHFSDTDQLSQSSKPKQLSLCLDPSLKAHLCSH